MKILYLGPWRKEMMSFLASGGDEVLHGEDAMGAGEARLDGAHFIVSYGYRHLLPGKVVTRFADKAINLHVSLLPWNRGADPNLWSFLENTPKGVTIHYIDRGLDTGDLLAQKPVDHLPDDTLRTSYQRLAREIEALFVERWPQIRAGKAAARRQPSGGSFHRARDRDTVGHLLTDGWDTPVAQLIGKAL